VDTSTLTILKQLAMGLAAQFGNNCEVLVHDLSEVNINHSIVHIENGHVTNRQVGGGPSPIVLDTISHHPKNPVDQLAYLTQTENGRILKSSTLFIKDDEGNPLYIFSINFDITNLLAIDHSLSSLISCPDEKDEKTAPKRITCDVNNLLDELIQQSVDLIGIPAPLMSRDDKIKAINFLNDAGAFLITKSGDKVSKYFGISKYTLYSYVDINK
jgi:predicted transcriptional regulator YheO